MFFPHKKIILFVQRRCLLSTLRQPDQQVLQSIQNRCLIQTFSWSAPHTRHVPETSPRKQSEARHNRTVTSSTLMFSFALVSNRLIPICSANFCASVVSTTLELGSSFLFPTEKMNIAKGDSTRATWKTELRAILPQNRCALDSRVESIFRSRMPRWRQSWTLSEQWKVQTHLIFGTRRHSSGWFHVAIVWRWRRTRHSWRRIPLWPHAFPCSIWTCTRGRETRSASDIQKLVDSQKLWLDLKTYSHAVSAQKNTKSASATSQMLSSLRWINNSNSWLK